MTPSRCNCIGFRLLLGLVLVIVTWLALTPQPAALPDVPWSDKWAHLATYLVLAFLVDMGWPERRTRVTGWVLLLVYGLAIELIQTQIPNRFFGIGDLVANAAGVALYGIAVRHVVHAWRPR